MSTWDRFVETFFNAKVMAKYLPDILSGMVVTIELAVLIVISGLFAGLVLALLRALAIRPLNWLIIFVVDLFRSLPPLGQFALHAHQMHDREDAGAAVIVLGGLGRIVEQPADICRALLMDRRGARRDDAVDRAIGQHLRQRRAVRRGFETDVGWQAHRHLLQAT